MAKDAFYWKRQLENFKSDNKAYFDQAGKCLEAYCDHKSYNIFYSNIQLLKAYLLTNNPKPEVERRFLKKATRNKLQYNTYLELANILEGALSYYADQEDLPVKLKDVIEAAKKTGRGVLWVTYEPIISQVVDEFGNVTEQITGREMKLDALGYEDYACSTSCNKQQVWWQARRHLLGKEELKEQFGYEAADDELNFTTSKESERKLAEVWEIWDKTEKKRIYILAKCTRNEFLKENEDPYKISTFFPCADLTPLTNGKNIIPIPEYELYRNKAVQLNKLSAKADKLEEKINYIITTDKTNQDNVADMANAAEGEIVTLQTPNPLAGNTDMRSQVGFVPIEQAVALAEHRELKKAQLKQDIYDITGIADIMRGQTDAQETATAQQIKGVFGTMRFQDQQKQVQDFVVSIYEIMAEIICENWDAETLADLTSAELPTEQEKAEIQAKIATLQTIQANPQYMQAVQQGLIQVPQVTKDEYRVLEQPTWEAILQIMRDEKLRNYSIDVQSSATVFDDVAAQTASLQQLSNTFKDIVASASTIQSPAVIRGYIPIAKMQLMNIKCGRAIAKQLIDALEDGAEELEKQIAKPQENPDVQLEKQNLAIKQADLQRKVMVDKEEAVKSAREFALQEAQLKGRLINDAEKNRIKILEEERKRAELEAQAAFKQAELAAKVNIDTNIPGEVRTLE